MADIEVHAQHKLTYICLCSSTAAKRLFVVRTKVGGQDVEEGRCTSVWLIPPIDTPLHISILPEQCLQELQNRY